MTNLHTTDKKTPLIARHMSTIRIKRTLTEEKSLVSRVRIHGPAEAKVRDTWSKEEKGKKKPKSFALISQPLALAPSLMEPGSALALLLLLILILLRILLRTAPITALGTLPTGRCTGACGTCPRGRTTRTALVIAGIIHDGDLVDTAVTNVRPLVVADEVEVLGVSRNFEDLAVPLAIRGVNAESRDGLVGGALPQRHLIRVLPEADEDIDGRWAIQIGAGNR